MSGLGGGFLRSAHGVADGSGESILEDEEALPGEAPVDIGLADEADQSETTPDGTRISPAEDGAVDVDFDPQQARAGDAQVHDANLALYMPEDDLSSLGYRLTTALENDLASRQEWETALATGVELLGMKVEERTFPFDQACGVYDPIMARAVIKAQSTARSELLPAEGPVNTEVVGEADDAASDRAWRVKAFMNLFLTRLSPDYYPDFDQMLFAWALYGSVFRKIYFDPAAGRPVSRAVSPQDFVVSYTTSDLLTCPRATHIVPMSPSEYKAAVRAGMYRKVDLGDPQVDPAEDSRGPLDVAVGNASGLEVDIPDDEKRYTFLEVYTSLDLAGFEDEDDTGAPTGISRPYRVTVDRTTNKVLSVYRNWREGDALRRPRQYFVHYKFLPGLGFYGFGYAHVLAGVARTGTSIRRQLIDAGTLNMFPGGLRVKGMRVNDMNIRIGPTQFIEIDTGGLPIQQAIMTMPYKPPPEVSFMLLKENTENGEKLASTTDIAVGEGRQDAPVGTTVALLEAANRVEAGTLKRAHEALSRELEMLYELFGEYLPAEPYPFRTRGGTVSIMKADFDGSVAVFPVSDPNVSSSTQRMLRAESLLRLAQQAPQIHDMRAAYVNMYTEMGVPADKIVSLLPPADQAAPADPLTENEAMFKKKPVKAAAYQDHDAHIASHQPLAQNPETQAAAMAHMAEHEALKMRQRVQMTLGQQLPPSGAKLSPEQENQVAVLVAQAMKQIMAEKKAEAAGQAPGEPTPGQVMEQQLQIERTKVAQQGQIAAAKDNTERFKATLRAGMDLHKGVPASVPAFGSNPTPGPKA